MNGLQRTTLGECCEIVSGATPSTSVANYWDGDVEWATPKDLSGLEGKLISRTSRRITNEGLASCAASVLPPNSVLFSSRAPIGHVAINTVPMATNQGFKSFIPKVDQVEPSFLYHWLRARRTHLERLGNGATFKEVSKAVVSRVVIDLPPLEDQRRIADILDKADAIRKKREEVITLTEELLRSAFLEMFGDPVTNSRGWPVTTLGDQADQMKYGTSEKCEADQTSGLPVLRIPNIVGGTVDWTDLKYADLEEKEVLGLRLSKGDLLFVRSNGNPEYIGRCAVYSSEREALFASYLIRVRLKSLRVEPGYVQAALTSSSYRALMTGEARTTAGNYNISTEGLRRLRLPLPPIGRQREFVAITERVRSHQSVSAKAAREADTLFNSLVARAFSGALESPR